MEWFKLNTKILSVCKYVDDDLFNSDFFIDTYIWYKSQTKVRKRKLMSVKMLHIKQIKHLKDTGFFYSRLLDFVCTDNECVSV